MTQIRTICVFCGSSSGNSPIYTQHASELGEMLAQDDITLVYGGGSIGVMGLLAKTVSSNGGRVIGIIPNALKQVSGDVIGDCVVVDSMHSRKAMMSEKSDAFIALPGGFGTMEELVEAITWSQLRIHSKPIGILNSNGYYDAFIQWMDKAVEDGFIDAVSRQLVVVATSPQELLKKLHEFQDPINGKWILSNDMWKKNTIHLEDV